MPYKLSATLKGHSADVRAVASPTAELVLSASRDTTAIAWTRSATELPFQPTIIHPSSQYVNSVAYLPPTTTTRYGYFVTGGQDAVINVYSLTNVKKDPDYACVGHTKNVCSLHTTSDGLIISGSWDTTARIWRDFQCLYILQGHEQSVLAVLAIDSDKFLTGSADKTIKLWHENKEIRTYHGHADVVRGLAIVPDIGFASCSNDSEIRVWTTDGDLIYTLSGHTSFIYSLSVLPNGDIVSAGEDRSARVWRDGECLQTIIHPAISVWTVSTMPNGDIVTGASDGVVRVFSTMEERWASESETRAYEEKVSSQALNTHQVGDLKESDIKSVDALLQPGRKEGQVLVVRDGESVDAYQWNGSARQWLKVGQVVHAAGSSRKQRFNGKEYDYVFDVDIKEGAPPLKLPYNVSENPFQAAQNFLNANDLPLSYVDEIVKFIEKNTTGVTLGSSDEFVDPYTGSSRYRSIDNPLPTARDPSSFSDPFTGSSSYSAPSSSKKPTSDTSAILNPILPIQTPLAFKQANVPAMRNKIFQINDALRMEISTSALVTSPEEMHSLNEVLDYLSSATASSMEAIASSPLNNSHIDMIFQILKRWPASQRFPIIDLARLAIAYAPMACGVPRQALPYLNAFFDAAEWPQPWTSPLSKTRETNVLLSLRAVGNVFQMLHMSHAEELNWVQPILENLLHPPYSTFPRNQRVALATIAFNVSCLFLNNRADEAVLKLHLTLITNLLLLEGNDSETTYRSLAALGNLLHASKQQSVVWGSSETKDLNALVSSQASSVSEERVKIIVKEIIHVLGHFGQS